MPVPRWRKMLVRELLQLRQQRSGLALRLWVRRGAAARREQQGDRGGMEGGAGRHCRDLATRP